MKGGRERARAIESFTGTSNITGLYSPLQLLLGDSRVALAVAADAIHMIPCRYMIESKLLLLSTRKIYIEPPLELPPVAKIQKIPSRPTPF